MRLLRDNVLYEFTVEQGGSRSTDHGDQFCDYDLDSDSSPVFRIAVRYRKFQVPMRRPVAVTEQSLDLSVNALLSREGNRNSAQPVMSQILQQFEVPPQIGEQMAEHFGFFAERLARRIIGGLGSGGSEIPIAARLDVRLLPLETAGGIRTRMESARAVDAVAPRRWREEGDEVTVPARRSSIEALERVRVGEGGRECAICLEELSVGAEVARMPCGHLYHCNCIVEWLQRTHFCPFCRFKMPC